VVSALIGIAAEVCIRGDADARFVFALAKSRAIELSKSKTGIWVEFWDASEVSPHHDYTFDSFDSATIAIVRWLQAA
jgi:hypothetical protein